MAKNESRKRPLQIAEVGWNTFLRVKKRNRGMHPTQVKRRTPDSG